MKIDFSKSLPSKPDAVVVVAFAGRQLSSAGKSIDAEAGGAVARAMKASRFTGAAGQFLEILAPAGVDANRIVVAGLGKRTSVTALGWQNLGGGLVGHLNRSGAARAAVLIDETAANAKFPADTQAANIALGARLRSYRFSKYRTKEKPENKPTLTALVVVVAGDRKAATTFAPMNAVADGVFFTRDLVTEPPNILYPESLAERITSLAELGVDVEALDEARMGELGMGALLGVGQGSARESRLVVMRWNGSDKGQEDPPLAFVGKGVTFDTGGISIKPSGGMEDMKWDMGGAGVVAGLMKALASRAAKVNAVGVVGLVENMPSDRAQRPSDVVTTMSGQTIEVLNTDAEGRLVLADALWYCQDTFKPRAMIDLATLTGAVIVALGSYRAGLFANDEALAKRLLAAGEAVGEEIWRLPLSKRYDKDINSEIADMKNLGKNREAGSITAAQLLQRFVNDVPWAHLDIAGVAWSKQDTATVPKGGTGFGVRLLDHFVAADYEATA